MASKKIEGVGPLACSNDEGVGVVETLNLELPHATRRDVVDVIS